MAMPVVRDDHAELLLIESVRSGDRFAFTELVRTQDRWIRSIVFGVLGRADALDDVCQQVWASVWGGSVSCGIREAGGRGPIGWRNAAIDAGRTRRAGDERRRPVSLRRAWPLRRRTAMRANASVMARCSMRFSRFRRSTASRSFFGTFMDGDTGRSRS